MFKQSVIHSFMKVRQDVSGIKKNVSDWFSYYNKKHTEQDNRIRFLEQRIAFLERKEMEKEW
ncbi:MAG TPA: hypothetical protein VJH97_05215 [Candidatus Nanoarchaeia archaeon]|nr:hypothetical protein [Candidatus Nanoarchaeia archaeon]